MRRSIYSASQNGVFNSEDEHQSNSSFSSLPLGATCSMRTSIRTPLVFYPLIPGWLKPLNLIMQICGFVGLIPPLLQLHVCLASCQFITGPSKKRDGANESAKLRHKVRFLRQRPCLATRAIWRAKYACQSTFILLLHTTLSLYVALGPNLHLLHTCFFLANDRGRQ